MNNLFLGFVILHLWFKSSADLSTSFEEFQYVSSATNNHNEVILQSEEEEVQITSSAANHLNHSTSAGATLAEPVSDFNNISNSSYELQNHYQLSRGEFTTTGANPRVINASCLFLGPPPEYQVFVTEDNAVGEMEGATNFDYSSQEPPPPYQVEVTESTGEGEIQGVVRDDPHSIQEAPPEYYVSGENEEDGEIRMIQNNINSRRLSQGSLSAYQVVSAGDNEIGTLQGVTDNTYIAQGPLPTYEEAVTTI